MAAFKLWSAPDPFQCTMDKITEPLTTSACRLEGLFIGASRMTSLLLDSKVTTSHLYYTLHRRRRVLSPLKVDLHGACDFVRVPRGR